MSKPKKENWFKRHKILTGILGVFLFFMIVGSLAPSETTSTSGQPTIVSDLKEPEYVVTASTLNSEYSANEVAADAKYKGKFVRVTGVVDTIGKDIVDSMYVTLSTGELFVNVQCMLEDSEFEKAATLSKGSSVSLVGKVNGSSLGLGVLIRKCVIE